jgi:hypothetical protein
MWLKRRRTNALLEPLVPVIGGEVVDGLLRGSYQRYGVEARPHTGFPIFIATGLQGAERPPQVDMFQLTLTGVAGRSVWQCQSSPGSAVAAAASVLTTGPLLGHFGPGEFRFEHVDTWGDSAAKLGEKFGRALGVEAPATADRELQERLVAAGLFDELTALRWGPQAYLPKVVFAPPGHELVQAYARSAAFARGAPEVNERLRAAGMPDLGSLIEARMSDLEARAPGRLVVDVEAAKERVPAAERFRELLDHAGRIAQINAEVNQPPQSA